MCGAALGSALHSALQGPRRTHSCLDLQQCSEVLQSGGLSAAARAKSFTDLNHLAAALLDGKAPVGELSTLRTCDDGSVSTHSGSEDTGRSSPTSSYDVLVRSRSPSAVVLSSEVANECVGVFAAAEQQQQQQQKQAAAAAAAAAAHATDDGIAAPAVPAVLHSDTPFLESATSFNVVEVPSTRPTLAACERQPSSSSGGGDWGTSSRQRGVHTVAAGTAAAGRPVDMGPPSHPSFTTVSCSAFGMQGTVVPVAQSPFARMEPPPTLIAQPPSLLLQQPPSALSISSGPSLSLNGASLSLGAASLGSAAGSSSSNSPTAASTARSTGGLSDSLARRRSLEGWGTSSHLSEGHAAEELFYRLNHARQTVDFVKRQATAFSALNKATMGVWEALELLNTLREYESALLGDADATPEMPLLEHALQCAEACRAAFPDEDYMHLAGLLAPLGKLLAHAKFGAEPQWAICGETFPVGCRFHPAVRHSQYFSANPDRRKRLYSSPTGVYREGCGLGSVLMSWGAGEYLHLVLRLNRVPLPPEALFCLRHQKLRCVFRNGSPYGELLSEFDRVQLPRLAKFQQLCTYTRMPRLDPLLVPMPDGGAAGSPGGEPTLQVNPSLRQYYDGLLKKYIPQGVLCW